MTTTSPTTDHEVTPAAGWVLVALSPELGSLSIPVTTSMSIGRHADNDVVLAAQQISRRHAKFNQVGTQLYLQDLNSANGTFVNAERIGNEAVAVTADDEIGFADLLFVLSLASQNLTNTLSEEDLEKTAASIPPTEIPPIMPEKVATEPVTLPTQVVEPIGVQPTVTYPSDESALIPTITAPVIESQTISPITTTTSSDLANKDNASKNMWLIAIVIILLIAGLVIAKMVL